MAKSELNKTDEKETFKKVSKTWLAMLKNRKTPGVEIIDMRAVLK